jgi:hypothetical protein
MARIVWDSARDGHWVDENDEIKNGTTLRVRMQDMPFLRDGRTQLTDTFKVDDAGLDQFRPGYRQLGDKARETVRNARQEMIDRATSAWRMDARKRKPEPDEDDDDDENGNNDARAQEKNPHQRPATQSAHDRQHFSDRRLDDIRAEMIQRLTDAWKSAATPNPKERTTNVPRRNAGLSTRDGAEPDAGSRPDDLQAKRDEAWNSYRASLSEAWKSPVGRLDPNRAGVVERERMAATFESRSSPSLPSPGDRA